jgi:hypothetical protein
MSPRPDHSGDLTRLLHDAVDDIHPHGTPADVRRRSDEGDTMTNPGALSRWLPLSVAAAVAMVLVIGGTAWLTNRNDATPPVAGPGNSHSPGATASGSPDDSTSDPAEPSQSADPEPDTRAVAVPVYFAGDTLAGPRLFREFQRAQVCADQGCAWTAAVRAAIGGTPGDPDYRTLWPAGAKVGFVKFNGELITVDLQYVPRERPAGMTADEAEMAVQQVVYTVQAAVNEGRKPVRLLAGEHPTDMLLGVPTSEPLAEDDADSTLAPVQIFTPAEGARVKSGFEVTGQAAAFEANVQWELRQGDRVVQSGFTTAKECCTLAPYSFTVKDVAPGDYTLVVHDDDASGMGRTNEDTKQITVVR